MKVGKGKRRIYFNYKLENCTKLLAIGRIIGLQSIKL